MTRTVQVAAIPTLTIFVRHSASDTLPSGPARRTNSTRAADAQSISVGLTAAFSAGDGAKPERALHFLEHGNRESQTAVTNWQHDLRQVFRAADQQQQK